MARRASDYHRQVADDKRAAIVVAATRLFAETGYDQTPLSGIARAAGVSTATLFKQFPHKATLFEAVVIEYWRTTEETGATPAAGAPEAGLSLLGTQYASLLDRDGMAGLFRLVIAEAPRFPELGRIQFGLGKSPFFDRVRRYLEAESELGTLQVDDPVMAATQFLGMISNYVLWPRMLLVDWDLSADAVTRVVDGAVTTMLARYGTATRPASSS